ncbi:putative protein kinase RLK-Pelle-CR4L family [Helianthus anomalus]
MYPYSNQFGVIYCHSIMQNKEKNVDHLKNPYSDLKLSTENFSHTYQIAFNFLYGCYRVELVHFDKQNPPSIEGIDKEELPKRRKTVVIKRIEPAFVEVGEKYFFLQKWKCCFETILVFDNVSNGYLSDYLGDIKDIHILTWEKRLKVYMDVAHALNYMHNQMEEKKILINNEICSGNIVLDEDWGARIAGFGFSTFLPPNQEVIDPSRNTMAISNFNIDPEYMNSGKLKRESNVFSFGVVLFELLFGGSAEDQYLRRGCKGLPHLARQIYNRRTLEEIIDPMIKEETAEHNISLKRGANKDSLDTY